MGSAPPEGTPPVAPAPSSGGLGVFGGFHDRSHTARPAQPVGWVVCLGSGAQGRRWGPAPQAVTKPGTISAWGRTSGRVNVGAEIGLRCPGDFRAEGWGVGRARVWVFASQEKHRCVWMSGETEAQAGQANTRGKYSCSPNPQNDSPTIPQGSAWDG